MYMQLEDDEREADYQALLADIEMIDADNMADTHPAEETMDIGEHILYKAWMLR